MTPTMSPTHPCPDLEELAAFVDGRLAGAARSALIEHLASCEDCYEVYAETLHVGEDLADAPAAVEGAEEELAPVVRHPRSFRWVWPTAAAALAAAATVFLVLRPAGVPSSGDLVAVAGIGTQAELGDDWAEHGWSNLRSGTNPYENYSPEERSFRIGVRVVDLRAAFELGDRFLAEDLFRELLQILDAEEFPFGQALYAPVLESFEAAKPTEELIAEIMAAEESLETEDSTYFELGRQVEAARLATLADNIRYFDGRGFRRYFRNLPTEELAEDVRQKVADFVALVETGPSAEDLEKPLEEIIAMRKSSV